MIFCTSQMSNYREPLKLKIDHTCRAGSWLFPRTECLGESHMKKLLQPRTTSTPSQSKQWVAMQSGTVWHSVAKCIINAPTVRRQFLSSYSERKGSTWPQLLPLLYFIIVLQSLTLRTWRATQVMTYGAWNMNHIRVREQGDTSHVCITMGRSASG